MMAKREFCENAARQRMRGSASAKRAMRAAAPPPSFYAAMRQPQRVLPADKRAMRHLFRIHFIFGWLTDYFQIAFSSYRRHSFDYRHQILLLISRPFSPPAFR